MVLCTTACPALGPSPLCSSLLPFSTLVIVRANYQRQHTSTATHTQTHTLLAHHTSMQPDPLYYSATIANPATRHRGTLHGHTLINSSPVTHVFGRGEVRNLCVGVHIARVEVHAGARGEYFSQSTAIANRIHLTLTIRLVSVALRRCGDGHSLCSVESWQRVYTPVVAKTVSMVRVTGHDLGAESSWGMSR